MKLVSFTDGRAGVMLGTEVLDIAVVRADLEGLRDVPATVLEIVTSAGVARTAIATAVEQVTTDISLAARLRHDGALVPLPSKMASPLPIPRTIFAAGMNYHDHLEEMKTAPPDVPYTFIKNPSCVIGSGDDILLPPDHGRMVDWEAELAVVVGRACYRATEAEAKLSIAGYMAANDVSARDWVDDVMASSGVMEPINRWARNILGKQYPTFCPMGPWLVTADEISNPADLDVVCRVNGREMQRSNTAKLVYPPAELISYLSRYQRLMPGDVILTGTMAGVGFGRSPRVFLRAGDLVEVEISGMGTLINSVTSGH